MISLRRIFSVSLLLFSALAQASVLAPATQKSYYPKNFYDGIESGLRDDGLKKAIHEILAKSHVPGAEHDQLADSCKGADKCYQHVSLGYNHAREILFGEIHLVKTQLGYGIFDVYCQKLDSEKDFGSSPPGPGKIPDGNVVNAEHTWPQSKFSGSYDKELQKSDLINLYPVMNHANSVRSSYKFGNVVTVLNEPCPNAKLGYTADGSKEPHFEAPNAHKGNVARAIFYFSIRYGLPISSEEETSLKAWHRADPVDDFEIRRNEIIFANQHDRNPFIDHPELVELISDF